MMRILWIRIRNTGSGNTSFKLSRDFNKRILLFLFKQTCPMSSDRKWSLSLEIHHYYSLFREGLLFELKRQRLIPTVIIFRNQIHLFILGFWFCGMLIRKKDSAVFNLFFQIDRGKTALAARNWINFAPQTDATTFAFASVSLLILCSMHSENTR